MNSDGDIERHLQPTLSPILRWAGGKRWLAPAIREVAIRLSVTGYLEPFVGGGAVFFGGSWPNPAIGDKNLALVRCYQGIAEDPREVRRILTGWTADLDTYRRVAHSAPTKPTACAARMLYLNRMAYGGIYRENRRGQFNVPFSGDRTMESIVSGSRLEDVARTLARASILHGDFEATLEHAREGTLIYCDPPYSLPGGEKSFRRYGGRPFDWADQQRLAEACARLVQCGSTVVISNSTHEMVRGLYNSAEVVPVLRRSTLNKGKVLEQKEAVYVLRRRAADAEEIADLLQKVLS